MSLKKQTIIPESLYEDLRTNEEIERQRELIKRICKENEAAFLPLVELAKKQQKKIERSNTIIRMDFSDGRYVFYSDSIVNDSANQETHTLPIVMTVHGIPGSAKDFNQLQFQTQSRLNCRWITFITPGLDRTDERRGAYRGYLEETASLINELLTRLHVEQPVVLIMHSAGGMYGKNFACHYPERVRALVQLACIGINRWKPIQIETAIFASAGVDVNSITRDEIDQEGFREKFQASIFKIIDGMSTEVEARKKEIIMFKGLHLSDHIMLLKAQVGGFEGGFNEFFARCRTKLRSIPRFFGYSAVDNLLEESHIHHEIYHAMLAEDSTLFTVPAELSKEPGNIFGQIKQRKNAVTAYVFEYYDAGHAVQHVKGFDLSVKLAHFITSLPTFEHNKIIHSRSML